DHNLFPRLDFFEDLRKVFLNFSNSCRFHLRTSCLTFTHIICVRTNQVNIPIALKKEILDSK
ncbi:MAG: hypothetical protein WCA08_22885, partial [Desulfoferrobacter sp.]